jgi:hypothetical protein
MRTFCFLLCISLFSSMFHAAAMPIERGPASTVDTVVVHEGHACEDASAPASTEACKLTGHLCCVGLLSAIPHEVGSELNVAQDLNPFFRTLVLQDLPNPQFKPPKVFSLS